MMIFMLVRSGASGSPQFFGVKSKVATGLFFLSMNIYSSQFWTHTCRTFSPVKYKESFYISDWEQTVNSALRPIYLPSALMSQEEKQMTIKQGGGGKRISENTASVQRNTVMFV